MNRHTGEILCAHCGCAVYDDDIICNLREVYGESDYITHEECVTDSLKDNRHNVLEYIFDDLSILSDFFDKQLSKYIAYEYFERVEEDE